MALPTAPPRYFLTVDGAFHGPFWSLEWADMALELLRHHSAGSLLELREWDSRELVRLHSPQPRAACA